MDIKIWNSEEEILQDCPHNQTIVDNLLRAYTKINDLSYNKILCSISGGADSDVMLDICYHPCGRENPRFQP